MMWLKQIDSVSVLCKDFETQDLIWVGVNKSFSSFVFGENYPLRAALLKQTKMSIHCSFREKRIILREFKTKARGGDSLKKNFF